MADSFTEYDQAFRDPNPIKKKTVVQESKIVNSEGEPISSAPPGDVRYVRQVYEDHPSEDSPMFIMVSILAAAMLGIFGLLVWKFFFANGGGIDSIKERSLQEQSEQMETQVEPIIKWRTRWKTKTVTIKDTKTINHLKNRISSLETQLVAYKQKVQVLSRERSADDEYREILKAAVRDVYHRPFPDGMGKRELCFTTDESKSECIYVKRKRPGQPVVNAIL